MTEWMKIKPCPVRSKRARCAPKLDPGWWIEPHRPGIRCQLHFGGHLQRPYLIYRDADKGLHVPLIWPEYDASLGYTALDGVLHCGGVENLILRRAPGTSLALTTKYGPVKFWATDLLHLDDASTLLEPARERATMLRQCIVRDFRPHRLFAPERLQAGDANFEALLAQGYAGVVARNPDASYRDGYTLYRRVHTVHVVASLVMNGRATLTVKAEGMSVEVGTAPAPFYCVPGRGYVVETTGWKDSTLERPLIVREMRSPIDNCTFAELLRATKVEKEEIQLCMSLAHEGR